MIPEALDEACRKIRHPGRFRAALGDQPDRHADERGAPRRRSPRSRAGTTSPSSRTTCSGRWSRTGRRRSRPLRRSARSTSPASPRSPCRACASAISRRPTAMSPAVANRHLVSNWMATPMVAEIATRWVADGTAMELVRWQREALRRRHAIAAEVLGAASPTWRIREACMSGCRCRRPHRGRLRRAGAAAGRRDRARARRSGLGRALAAGGADLARLDHRGRIAHGARRGRALLLGDPGAPAARDLRQRCAAKSSSAIE